jgi:hypothetical protein
MMLDDCYKDFVFEVGPFHTTAGLQRWIYSKKRNTNKQIFMITDGKPSCVREKMGAII